MRRDVFYFRTVLSPHPERVVGNKHTALLPESYLVREHALIVHIGSVNPLPPVFLRQSPPALGYRPVTDTLRNPFVPPPPKLEHHVSREDIFVYFRGFH